MRLFSARFLLILHISALLGYNLFNATHEILHLLESAFHHHEHHFEHHHSIKDHHFALEMLQDNQSSDSNLTQEFKIFYFFVYISHSLDVDVRDTRKVIVLHNCLFSKKWINISLRKPSPPPENRYI